MAKAEINIPEEGKSNFNWALIDGLMVSYARTGAIPQKRFQGYLDALRTRPITHMLSISTGGPTIDSVQRKTSADIAKEKNIKIAVVLDSAVARGVITAFSWLGVNIKSFGPGKESEALEHLAVPNLTTAEILSVVQQLGDMTIEVQDKK